MHPDFEPRSCQYFSQQSNTQQTLYLEEMQHNIGNSSGVRFPWLKQGPSLSSTEEWACFLAPEFSFSNLTIGNNGIFSMMRRQISIGRVEYLEICMAHSGSSINIMIKKLRLQGMGEYPWMRSSFISLTIVISLLVLTFIIQSTHWRINEVLVTQVFYILSMLPPEYQYYTPFHSGTFLSKLFCVNSLCFKWHHHSQVRKSSEFGSFP